MTAVTGRPGWRYALRGFALFLLGGGLGAFGYATVSHRPGGMPWGGVLFGALVCAVLSALFARRRRGRRAP
ncbi:hypothetical protein AB0N17_05110 [Streptomyces sp. NPDC051133]|uniref:hypothetical protein n=1 Tax=Streptomyces sp. NPDC051133 TaxID=3155521 RepID=UPI0034245BF0